MKEQASKHNLPRTILLLIWSLMLIFGLWGSWFLPSSLQFLSGTWGRMASSLALVALSMLAIRQVPYDLKNYARLIAGGMLLGTIGDFFNADLLKFITSNGTIGAIVAFGIGHLFYSAAIIGRLLANPPIRQETTLLAVFVWQIVGILSWFVVVYQGQNARDLVWPALAYCLLLSGTTGLASALASSSSKVWWLAVGAALFLLSDLLLAVGMFRGSYPLRSEAVWLTYGPAQMLIVCSCWSMNKIEV